MVPVLDFFASLGADSRLTTPDRVPVTPLNLSRQLTGGRGDVRIETLVHTSLPLVFPRFFGRVRSPPRGAACDCSDVVFYVVFLSDSAAGRSFFFFHV